MAPAEVPHQDQSAEMHKVAVDNSDNTNPETMVSPLQQKLELLKKAAGVESMYDAAGCGAGGSTEADELDAIKKNAGLRVITVNTAAEDNDFEA